MMLMPNSSIFHQPLKKHLHLLSYQSTLLSWEPTTVYQYTHHRSSHTRYYRTCVQAHTSASTIFCRHYSKLMIHSHQYYYHLQLRLQLIFIPVELQTSDTILTPPPILYIHMPQSNNTEPPVVLLELETKFSILRYLLLRIKQSY